MQNTHTASATLQNGSKATLPCASKSAAMAQVTEWLASGATSGRVSPIAKPPVKATSTLSGMIPAWAVPIIEG